MLITLTLGEKDKKSENNTPHLREYLSAEAADDELSPTAVAAG